MKKKAWITGVLLVTAMLFLVTGCKLFNQTPVCYISASALSGKAPLEVTFEARVTDDSESFTCDWNFGDGEIGGGPRVVHIFRNVGSYTVELKVTDNDGAVETVRQSIEVTNAGPTRDRIEFRKLDNCTDCGRTKYCTHDLIQITVVNPRPTANGLTITDYDWSFGDGSTDTASDTPIINHIYSFAGIYTVKVTITDSQGVSNTFSETVAIEECCRSCMRDIFITTSACHKVGCSMELCGNFGDRGHSGCERLAKALEASAKSGTAIEEKDYCDPDPCDCDNSCDNCGCRDGEWEWRINDGGCETIEYGQCINFVPTQTGSLTVRLYYTCGNKTVYASKSFDISE